MDKKKKVTIFFSEKIIPILYEYRKVFVLCGLFAALLFGHWIFTYMAYQNELKVEQERDAIEKATLPAWERKIVTDEELRLAIASDLRIKLEDNYTFASDIEDRYFAVEKYMKPLAFFRSEMEAFEPDHVAFLGDAIAGEDQDENNGSDALSFVKRQLSKMNVPIIWVLGNRDLRALTRVQFQEVTDSKPAPYKVESDHYKIIVLDSNNNENMEPFDTDTSEDGRGSLTPEQYVWLEDELKTAKNVVVLLHHGVFAKSVPEAGSEKKREKSMHDALKLRELFSRYQVAAVFTSVKSHAYDQADGVEYFAIEDLRDYGHHPGAFYTLVMRGSDVDVELYYIDRDNEKLKSQTYQEGAFRPKSE